MSDATLKPGEIAGTKAAQAAPALAGDKRGLVGPYLRLVEAVHDQIAGWARAEIERGTHTLEIVAAVINETNNVLASVLAYGPAEADKTISTFVGAELSRMVEASLPTIRAEIVRARVERAGQ